MFIFKVMVLVCLYRLFREGDNERTNLASDRDETTQEIRNRNNKFIRKSTPKAMLFSQISLMNNIEDEERKVNKSKIPKYSKINNSRKSTLLEAKNAYDTSIDEQIQKIKQNFNPGKVSKENK